MIIYLKNHEIDRDLWDSCIKAANPHKPYAFSWYLDIMSPGWEALIDDDYDSVFPVPARQRFGIKYVATPVFLQQLGAFSPDKSAVSSTVEFLDYMPEFYRLVDLCIGQEIYYDGYSVTRRSNFQLDLSKPYDALFSAFDNSCKKNIEKSAKRVSYEESKIDPGELIDLFIIMKQDLAKKIKQRDFSRLRELMEYCQRTGKGFLKGYRGRGGKLLFGQFYIQLPGYINLLFGVNTEESREKRINYYFVNEIIRQNAGKNIMLDFAGSSIPPVATFMQSFGSSDHPYFRIYRNKLIWPLGVIKK
ncbi:MAG: hypothetical protein U0X39_04160 [Bacteroidales bacterium]